MLCVIPARGGSKGLPGKNVKLLEGRPLIHWTIEAARGAASIDRVVVSTDSAEIADVARAGGAEVPFLRPADLARDDSPALAAYLFTIEELERSSGRSIPAFVVCQPTSPLRTAADIDGATALFATHDADSVLSVTPSPHPPAWLKKLGPDDRLADYFAVDGQRNRQELPSAWLPNGAVYVFRTALLRDTGRYTSERTWGYRMPAERSVDIDTALDFELASLLIRR